MKSIKKTIEKNITIISAAFVVVMAWHSFQSQGIEQYEPYFFVMLLYTFIISGEFINSQEKRLRVLNNAYVKAAADYIEALEQENKELEKQLDMLKLELVKKQSNV